MKPVRLEPAALRSRVKHSTTELQVISRRQGKNFLLRVKKVVTIFFHLSYSLDRDFEGKQWEALSNAVVDLLSSI